MKGYPDKVSQYLHTNFSTCSLIKPGATISQLLPLKKCEPPGLEEGKNETLTNYEPKELDKLDETPTNSELKEVEKTVTNQCKPTLESDTNDSKKTSEQQKSTQWKSLQN
jgi:hypothetical protein